MLKIRLTRRGRRNRPYYRVVVINSTTRRDGAYLEEIGSYDPGLKEKNLNIKSDRYDYWISKGAQPSDGIRRLYKK